MKNRISAGLAFNNLVCTLCLALVKLHFSAHNLVIRKWRKESKEEKKALVLTIAHHLIVRVWSQIPSVTFSSAGGLC